MYTILAWLARPAFMRESHDHPYRRILAIATGIIIYGVLLDILQPLLSSRNLEWTDILANTTGVLCGSLLWRVVPPCAKAPRTQQ
jgi:VanZ family protein